MEEIRVEFKFQIQNPFKLMGDFPLISVHTELL